MADAVAIPAIRRTFKQLVDGTLRVTVDVEPYNAADFLRLMPAVDMPVALAPLDPTAAAMGPIEPSFPSEGSEPPTAGPLKGGKLAQDAAIICATAEFQHFVELQGVEPVGEEIAAEYVRQWCVVESRAELDHDYMAARAFASLMAAYRAWRKKA